MFPPKKKEKKIVLLTTFFIFPFSLLFHFLTAFGWPKTKGTNAKARKEPGPLAHNSHKPAYAAFS